MGTDFYLACSDCHEFIDLHKWPIIERARSFLVDSHFAQGYYPDQTRIEDSPYQFVDLDTLCKKVLISADDLETSLRDEIPDHPYIRTLRPIVEHFASSHRGHPLYLSCDLGDPGEDPWWPGRTGFADWKEIPGAFNFHRYLPRNMIEVDGFSSWTEAVEKLQKEWPFVDEYVHQVEIEAIRKAFEERRNIPPTCYSA